MGGGSLCITRHRQYKSRFSRLIKPKATLHKKHFSQFQNIFSGFLMKTPFFLQGGIVENRKSVNLVSPKLLSYTWRHRGGGGVRGGDTKSASPCPPLIKNKSKISGFPGYPLPTPTQKNMPPHAKTNTSAQTADNTVKILLQSTGPVTPPNASQEIYHTPPNSLGNFSPPPGQIQG